tara:strand:- start:201 stop:302 length:102 start_codon:yes stop_codon:yes gene_type:complete
VADNPDQARADEPALVSDGGEDDVVEKRLLLAQ